MQCARWAIQCAHWEKINVQWPHWAHPAAAQHQQPSSNFWAAAVKTPFPSVMDYICTAGCCFAAWMHISGSVIAHHSSGATLHVFVLFFVKNTFLLYHSCHICWSLKKHYTWRNTPAAAPAACWVFLFLFCSLMSFACFCFVLCQKHFFIIPFARYLPFFRFVRHQKLNFEF
jgi:hypothetical protein